MDVFLRTGLFLKTYTIIKTAIPRKGDSIVL